MKAHAAVSDSHNLRGVFVGLRDALAGPELIAKVERSRETLAEAEAKPGQQERNVWLQSGVAETARCLGLPWLAGRPRTWHSSPPTHRSPEGGSMGRRRRRRGLGLRREPARRSAVKARTQAANQLHARHCRWRRPKEL